MRKIGFWLSIALLTASSNGHCEFNRPLSSVEINTAYRHDNFRWSIEQMDFGSSDSSSPSSSSCSSSNQGCCGSSRSYDFKDTLYKALWKKQEIYEITGRAWYQSCNNYYIRANADYGTIYAGRNRNSSYTCLSHPERETSRIKGLAKNGHVMDVEGGVGYSFTSNGRRTVITPVVGWSYHEQLFHLNNARQTINRLDDPSILGPIPNLRAKYKPWWYGFWAGTDFLVSVEVPCVLIFGSFEYHWAQFHAKGDWNYNNLFITQYRQRTNGHGFDGYIGFNYKISCNWYLGVIGTYKNWQAQKGRHKTIKYENDLTDQHQGFGTMPVVPIGEHTRIRSIRWNSWSIGVTLAYRMWP